MSLREPTTRSAASGTAGTVDPCTDAGWQRLASARGSLFVSPPWLRAVSRTYGFDVRAHVIEASPGTYEAGLPFVEIDDLCGRRVSCVPFSDFCDPMLAGSKSWTALADPLIAIGSPVALRCLHARAPRADARFEEVGTAFWHRIDLCRSAETMWSSLGSSARRNVRRATRSGVTVAWRQDRESVATFHRLHRDLRREKYGMLAQPVSFFENIRDEFGPSGEFFVQTASHDRQTIAAMVFLVWSNTLYYKFGTSSLAALAVRPNDLLMWEAMRFASERGLRWIDLGISDADQDGLVRFKRKFAEEEAAVSFLRHTPTGHADPRGPEARALLGELTKVLVRDDVPDEVRERAAELLYRHFC